MNEENTTTTEAEVPETPAPPSTPDRERSAGEKRSRVARSSAQKGGKADAKEESQTEVAGEELPRDTAPRRGSPVITLKKQQYIWDKIHERGGQMSVNEAMELVREEFGHGIAFGKAREVFQGYSQDPPQPPVLKDGRRAGAKSRASAPSREHASYLVAVINEDGTQCSGTITESYEEAADRCNALHYRDGVDRTKIRVFGQIPVEVNATY